MMYNIYFSLMEVLQMIDIFYDNDVHNMYASYGFIEELSVQCWRVDDYSDLLR